MIVVTIRIKESLLKCDDSCLEYSIFKIPKMLDLQTKSAIDSDNLRV